ncbi:LacI family DNA-binding transcriptional regulator [Paenibacillus sp. MMS20-IR301]|uniref:LacI family DNA-binding transcriptional regulator n=1 Tax=Paenibacillus sp. MMS20-IR301 TaxID=2895946 RepID=UPI0028EC3F78|nr:LacI family DNA-binding transcriptional regulator [Paenibacillus sp. MMS20-IR301]WNS45259.1 LacI family DNA-binding transcriptional regulator [Paenibacillus sp. MMS20-IR301]
MKMEDIARIANVSKAAVSLAFSGKPGIGEETRERILQIAHESGYKPRNRVTAAAAQVHKSLLFLVFTNSGIVTEDYYQQPFFKELIQFIGERCRAKGYELVFSTIDIGSFDEGIQNLAEDNRSDGVIVLGTNLTRGQITAIGDKVANLVVLDTCYEMLPLQFIQINNVMGAYRAGSYLIEHGHTEIGYIASNVRIHNFEERERGFLKALSEHEITEACRLSVAPTILSSQESLKQQLSAFLSEGHPLPTAWFCECDYIAISAMKTMSELGIRVPQDCSIIGFDNITESLIVTPELTTVHVDKEKLAALAVDLLADYINHPQDAPKTKFMIDTKFIERSSSVVRQ